MKQIYITDCSDPQMWYYDFVGTTFTYLGEEEGIYWVRDSYGYRNIVLKDDGLYEEESHDLYEK